MQITSVRDNENNTWKENEKHKQTNKQTNKDRREQRGTEAIEKRWELNDLVVHLS